jgi:Tol biopolymer transport system component
MKPRQAARLTAASVLMAVLLAAYLMAVGVAAAPPQAASAEKQLEAAIHREQVLGDVKGAVEQYKQLAQSSTRAVAAQALVHLGQCYEKLGEAQLKDARATYERVVKEFGDQAEPTKLARARLSALTAGASGAAGRTEVAMRQVWVGKDWVAGISPDGRYAVHIVPGASRGNDYWLRDLQSGEQKQINREALSSFSYPALISPDGKWIAYACAVGKCYELRVSALDGSSMRALIPCQTTPSTMMSPRAWMPNSRELLVISSGVKDGGFGSYQRHIMSVPDGTVREMGQPVLDPAPPTAGFQYVGFGIYPAPDGRHVAYTLKRDIYIYDVATEQDSVLVQSPAADYLTGWTPDGSGIVFLSDRSGTNDLYLLRIENGQSRGDPQLLRRDFGANTNLSLTRDGRLFRIDNTRTWNSFIVPVDEQTGKLSGPPSPVDANYPNVLWPKWSRDGRSLYYQIYKQPADDRSRLLFIRSEATGETREVTPKPQLSYWSDPTLSPDGRGFMIPGAAQNMNWGLFAVDSESGDMSQLLKLPSSWVTIDWDLSPNWSPDGKAIFYKIPPRELDEKKPSLTEFMRASKDFIIVRKELATGEEKDVHHGVPTADMQISPDGTRFVYQRRDMAAKSNVLGILDLQSDKELELWRVPQAESPGIGSPTWTPDGNYVLVGKDLKQGTELWRFPAAGGPGEKLHSFPQSTMRFVLHPSGKRMAFTQPRTSFELWVLENFLPAAKSPAK